jgi:hypothetical protein
MKKKNEGLSLTKEDFSFVCPMKQAEMREVEGGFFCETCEEKVHDVSHMNKHEYQTLLKSKENVCVTFKRVVATSLAFGLVACAEPKSSKPLLMGKIAPNKGCQTKPIKPPKENKLSPYKAIDTNKTIEIAGGMMVPQSLKKKK